MPDKQDDSTEPDKQVQEEQEVQQEQVQEESKPDKPETDSAETEESKPSEENAEETKEESEESESKEEKPPKDREARKQFFKDKQSRSNKRTEQELAQEIQKEYPAKSEQDYIDQGLSEREAQLEARMNNFEYQQEVSKIARLNTQLQDDAQKVYKDFPMFNPKDKENYDPEFAQKVEDRYRRVARYQTEKLGGGVIVTNAEEPLYDFYAEAAEFYNKGSSKGASKGQEDALKMMSRAEQPSNQSTPTSEKKLSDMSREERIKHIERKVGTVRI